MLGGLRFSSPQREALGGLTEAEWKKALAFCDRAHLTLPVGLACRDALPEPVRSRIDLNLANNALRWERTKAEYSQVARALEAEGLEFLVLKGFSQCPGFVCNPRHRAQNDLDLFLPEASVRDAFSVARGLEYLPLGGVEDLPTDHLPTMIRRTGWEWRGDFFDPEIPLSLELHFRFWDSRTEGFAPEGLECFWARRQRRELDGLRFTSLHPADAVAYSSLHLLRHLLRGNLRPYHVYELASLLHRSAGDATFWKIWSELHPESLKESQAICFELARRWFDCRMPDTVQEAIGRLPPEVGRWLALSSLSPLAGLFHPNKDELWLHWNLVDSRRARAAVLRRRLLPARLPGAHDAAHLTDSQRDWRIRLRSEWRRALFIASRTAHHLRAMPATAWSAARWFGIGTDLGAPFWKFVFAQSFYNVGLFVYFLMYALYLVQIGFHEDFIGLVAGAMTTGSIAGAIPAGILTRNIGIRKTLLVCIGSVVALSALRASVTFAPALIGLAFFSGMASSAWAVTFSPAVAQLTNERNRSKGFSIICALGTANGILGGLFGGRLPGWFLQWRLAQTTAGAYRGALLAGCAIAALTMLPLWRLNLGVASPGKRTLHRPSPRIVRFLAVMAVWSAGTAMFNPFHNVLFARLHMPVKQIGLLLSASQVAQSVAMLLAPLALRKVGLTRGISLMQIATAMALAAIAISRSPSQAAVAYVIYMAFQYMGEPGMFTYLMEGVSAGERGGVSALNFLVGWGAQAVAAAAAGAALARLGYSPVLAAAAVICLLAALLFRALPQPETPPVPSGS